MEFFDLKNFPFFEIIDQEKPWLSLDRIESYFRENQTRLVQEGYYLRNQALIHQDATIDDSAKIEGLALIGANTVVGDSVLLRKGVIIGNNCKIGHATEVKHSIILNNTAAGHFNYIGDSVVGNNVNFGAGSILANLKSGSKNKIISVYSNAEKIATGLEKFGSVIGDNVKIGSNAVLNPGTMVGQNSVIYPLALVRGFIPENKIVKNSFKLEIVDKE